MPGPKAKKSKKSAKPAPSVKRETKKTAPAKKPKVSPARAVRREPPAPKKMATAKAPLRPAATASEGIWFRVADGIEHAVVQKTSEGSVTALTDAGARVVVAAANVFKTAAEARAHGQRW